MINLLGGHIQNSGGVAVPNGSISFQLNTDATIIAEPGGQIPAGQVVLFSFDANGDLIQPVEIYSNAELQPQNANGKGTFYLVSIYDANGAPLNASPLLWQFTQAANSTVDISTMTPYFTGGTVIYYASPLTLPSGSNEDVQFNNSGVFGGNDLFQWNNTTLTLTFPNLVLGGTLTDGTGSVGTSGQVLSSTVTGTAWVAASGGGSPAGSDTSIQYNKAGAFGGDSNLLWDYVNEFLTVGSQTDQFVFAGVLDGLWSLGVDDAVGGNSIVGIVDRSLSTAALQCLTTGASAQLRAVGSTPAVVLTTGSATFTAEPTLYEITDGTDFIASVINNSTPAATTQFETNNASLELGASGNESFVTLGAASGPTLTISAAKFAPFALVTGSLKFLNTLILGGALEDGSASAGSSGNILSSTGTATAWTGAPVLNTLTLSAATPTVSSGQIGFGTSTDTAATAGSNGAVPAQVAGYLDVNIGGTMYKIPYFAA